MHYPLKVRNVNYDNALNSKNQKEKEKDTKTCLSPLTLFLLQLKRD